MSNLIVLNDLKKNTMIFGFNGAGKSTLSDIFYSLTSREKQGLLSLRRTLNKPMEKMAQSKWK